METEPEPPERVRDVVVVGAGPVGLALALGLARDGRDVLVLEREAGPVEHSRAPAIWPRTQEILAGLGVIDAFRREGIDVPRLELHDADRGAVLLSLPLEELADCTAHARLLVLPQSRTERLLLDALGDEPRADVRFASEVTDVVAGTERVEVTTRSGSAPIAARFVAGCDGAHSTVRERLGATFDGRTYRVCAALADVEPDEDAELGFPRITTRPRLAIAIRMRARLWRLILPRAEHDETPLARRRDEAVASLFGTGYRTVWESEFRLHRRVSSTFQRGRVVLAGDAAHLNSPVGGQGMNAGIADAEHLARALGAALDADAVAPLVDYARARRDRIRAGVNRFTDLLTRVLLFRRGRMIRFVLRVARVALRVPGLRRRFLERLAMLEP